MVSDIITTIYKVTHHNHIYNQLSILFQLFWMVMRVFVISLRIRRKIKYKSSSTSIRAKVKLVVLLLLFSQTSKLICPRLKLNIGSGQAISWPDLNLHLTCKYVTYRFRYSYHESAVDLSQESEKHQTHCRYLWLMTGDL